MLILMLIGVLTLMIENPLVVIVYFWVTILFHGLQKSSTQSLVLQLNLNTECLLQPLQKFYGLLIFLKSLRFLQFRLPLYIVITRVLKHWPVIRSIILGQNISSWIFILFGNILLSSSFKSLMFPAQINMLTFLQSLSPLMLLLIFATSLMSFPYLKLEGGC